MEWQKGLEEGRYASKAAIARELGISRARVTQILNVLKLPPDQLQKVAKFVRKTTETIIKKNLSVSHKLAIKYVRDEPDSVTGPKDKKS